MAAGITDHVWSLEEIAMLPAERSTTRTGSAQLRRELAHQEAGRLVKRVAIFLFLAVNGAWALMAYVLHAVGARPGVIAIVLPVGVLLGNLATYAGIKLAGKMLHKGAASISN